jgi:integrase
MSDVQLQIKAFLNKKKTAWSEATIASCSAFLNKYGSLVAFGTPESLLQALSEKGRYTVTTYFAHAASFYEFLHPDATNIYAVYRKDNRNAFKNAYQSKKLNVNYDQVKAVIEAQAPSDEKEACLYLLKTAQRSSEAGLARNGRLEPHRGNSGQAAGAGTATIVGKGGKPRINLGADLFPAGAVRWNYYRVYRYLRQLCGISPHALRKLALTRAGERGAGAADLCEIAGWSSINTAIRYLQPQRAQKLRTYLD